MPRAVDWPVGLEDCPDAYTDKLYTGTGVRYSQLFRSRRLPEAVSAAAGADGAARHALVSLGDEYILVVHPLVFACMPGREAGLRLKAPLELPAMLNLVEAVTRPDVLDELTTGAVRELGLQGIEQKRIVMEGRVAVQLWDLNGSRLPGTCPKTPTRPNAKFDAARETTGYCWELSALMTHASDHILANDRWRTRSPFAVLAEVREGFTFLSDHFVLLNETCCLEITHTPGDPDPRFINRLAAYGYDSTSIFVWTLAAFREGVLQDLDQRYRAVVGQYARRSQFSSAEYAASVRRQTEHEVMVSRLDGLSTALKEPRNRELEAEIAALHHHGRAVAAVEAQMARASVLATELDRGRQEAARSRTNLLLAFLGIGVAVSGIPQGVDQVSAWVGEEEWVELGIAAGLVVVLILLIYRLLQTGREALLGTENHDATAVDSR